MILSEITSRLRESLRGFVDPAVWSPKNVADRLAPVVASLLEEEGREHAAEIIELVREVTKERKRAEQAEAETQALREALEMCRGLLGRIELDTDGAEDDRADCLHAIDERLAPSSATPRRKP